MKRTAQILCAATIAFMTTAQGTCFAAETNDPPSKGPADELVGTTWRVKYHSPDFGPKEYNLEFHPKGKLINTHPSESTPDNDTWEVKGGKVILKFNDAFAVYTGQFTDRDHLSGNATSKRGTKWNWKAHRIDKTR